MMTAFMVAQVAEVTGRDAAEFDPQLPLAEVGLDSASITELSRRLGEATGTEISSTAGWRYPTLDALGGHVADLVGVPLDGEPQGAVR